MRAVDENLQADRLVDEKIVLALLGGERDLLREGRVRRGQRERERNGCRGARAHCIILPRPYLM